jgi:hypothetical protein
MLKLEMLGIVVLLKVMSLHRITVRNQLATSARLTVFLNIFLMPDVSWLDAFIQLCLSFQSIEL